MYNRTPLDIHMYFQNRLMKILISNYRYFITSGPERYLFSLTELLEAKGHHVIPFSVKYSHNVATQFSKYFVPPPAGESEVLYRDMSLNLVRKVKLFMRVVYSFESRRRIQNLIRDEKPDLAYLLYTMNMLSPSIIDGCKQLGIPVIFRISDFHLVCPAYHFFRKGQICEECERGLYHALYYRCLQNSLSVTFARVVSMYIHKLIQIYDKVDAIVTPSQFMKMKMIKAGFNRNKIHHIPSFVDFTKYDPSHQHDNYILYFGRIAKEKGIEVLIRAFNRIRTNVKLRIVGNPTDSEIERLKDILSKEETDRIAYVGFRSGKALRELVQNSIFTVVPSLWYENTPLAIYESMAAGKPVIGSNIGSIPEQIQDGVNGLLFQAGSVDDLAEKIQNLLQNPQKRTEMGKRARKDIEEKYNPELHYGRLMNVFKSVFE